MEDRNTKILVGILIAGGLFVALIMASIIFSVGKSINGLETSLFTDGDDESESIEAPIAVITVSGVIMKSKTIVENLMRAEEDDKIKAIILRINSPGGAVAPTQEIYEEIRRIDKIKPIYSSMGSIAASGGYYLSAATRKIYANPGTLTGSIGVIMNFVDMSKLYDFAKMSFYSVKSGKYKDIGHPYRRITDEEQKLMKDVMNNVHSQFLEDINRTRKDKLKKNLNELAQGQIFSGAQALEYGLVDELAGLWAAGRKIHTELNFKSKFKLKFIKKKKRTSIFSLIKNIEDVLTPLQLGALVDNTPMLIYRNK